MTKRLDAIIRKARPFLAAGVLLQAGGCQLDINALAAGLTTSIVNTLITDWLFGVFNLSTF